MKLYQHPEYAGKLILIGGGKKKSRVQGENGDTNFEVDSVRLTELPSETAPEPLEKPRRVIAKFQGHLVFVVRPRLKSTIIYIPHEHRQRDLDNMYLREIRYENPEDVTVTRQTPRGIRIWDGT